MHSYNMRLGDPGSITPEQMRRHTASLDLADADVIFLGGREYAELLRDSVPHAFCPLTGGMLTQRRTCREVRESRGKQDAWWSQAAELFERHHRLDS